MEPFAHAAAGHPGTLQTIDGSLFAKPTSETEIEFYNYIEKRHRKGPTLDIDAIMSDELKQLGSGMTIMNLSSTAPCLEGKKIFNGHNEETDEIENVDDDIPLAIFLPKYYGTLTPGMISISNSTDIDDDLLRKSLDTLEIDKKTYLLLSNALHGFSKPSVLDIKLGRILYASDATQEKKDRMKRISKATTSGSLGYRIAGMKLWEDDLFSLKAVVSSDEEEDGQQEDRVDTLHNIIDKLPVIKDIDYSKVLEIQKPSLLSFNKFFGRNITASNMPQALNLFFRYNNLPKEIQDEVIGNFVTRMQVLYNCLLDEEVRIRSSSLLLVLETDVQRWQRNEFKDNVLPEIEQEDDSEDSYDNESGDIKFKLSTLQLIDFAHAHLTPGKGYDEELLFGLENLFTLLKEI
ncbi:inositol polyphosphate multikinase [Martiniozyma asiatica (nom. inval.)]|nr:inositol polyphosphate multikinase [Martiniozyma asiatica]